MSKIYNIALVGVGFHATTTLLPTLIHLPVRLAAVVDRDEERANAVAHQFGCKAYSDTQQCYQAENLDAVLLCVGQKQHPTLIAEALSADLHVWAEKPAAENVEALDVIFPQVNASNKIAMVGYKKAFMPAVDKIKEIMAREDTGAFHHLVAQYPVGIPGAWLANSCHPLACILACAGPVDRLRLHLGKHGGGTLSLQFKDGGIGTLIMANKTKGLSERYQIFCEGAQIDLEDGNRLAWHRGGRGGKNNKWIGEGDDHGSITWEVQNCYARPDNRLEVTQGFHHELAGFFEAIETDTKPQLGGIAFARALTEIYQLVAENADSDAWLDCRSADWRVPVEQLATV